MPDGHVFGHIRMANHLAVAFVGWIPPRNGRTKDKVWWGSPTSDSIAQSRALQFTVPEWSLASHGRPSWLPGDVLLYGVACLAR